MRDRLHRSETGSKILIPRRVSLFQSHRFLIRIPQLTSYEDEEEEGWRQPALPLLRDASDSYPKLSCDPPRFPDKACKPTHQPTSLTSHPNVAQAGPSRLRDSPPSIIPTGYQWYIHHLDSHILSSYNNTLGRSPLDRFKRLDPSPIPPTSITWTTEEKRLFFRSLSRYSRLRPDRIAGDIRTKSQAEVEWYLALLQGAVESRRRTDGARRGFTNRSTRGFANRSTRGDRHQSRREGRAEGACEVSEDWVVKEEEELALAVEKNVQRREKVREDDVRAKRRKELRGAMSMSRQEGCASWDDPAIEEAERVDALEDWGKSLNSTKLGALDKLLMPERAEWYAKRLKTRKEPFPSPSPSDAPANTSRSITTDHSIDKNGEIAKETRRLKELTAIPKQDRTHEQKAEYSKSLNRKRARENYRTAKLLAEGMTEDEILRLGGADAVFASRGGGKPGCVLESGDEVKRLKRMGMDTYIKQKRWEVFNFDRMAQLIQSVIHTQ